MGLQIMSCLGVDVSRLKKYQPTPPVKKVKKSMLPDITESSVWQGQYQGGGNGKSILANWALSK